MVLGQLQGQPSLYKHMMLTHIRNVETSICLLAVLFAHADLEYRSWDCFESTWTIY